MGYTRSLSGLLHRSKRLAVANTVSDGPLRIVLFYFIRGLAVLVLHTYMYFFLIFLLKWEIESEAMYVPNEEKIGLD